MGRVSKKVIDKKLLDQLEDQFSFLIGSLKNRDEINDFMNEFLTKEEKIMLGKRLILYMMLYKGMTSKQIHNSLGMSLETIHWYKQIYDSKSQIFIKNIEKLIGRERSKEMWAEIERILEPVSLALDSKTNMKARSKLFTGDFWKR
ncbi:MAG: Trp family transcriptional regulator [Patescibacteria group bacterium]